MLYDTRAPTQFRLDTFEDLWLLPATVIAAGAFFTLVGIGGLIGAVLLLSNRRSAGQG